jgi:DNA-binding transcriptional MerR regulator
MLVIDGEQFLSTSEVALRFGVSPRTILRWHENNPEEMGAVTGINGRMYFNKSKIDQTIKRIYFKSGTPTNGAQRRLTSRRPQTVTA